MPKSYRNLTARGLYGSSTVASRSLDDLNSASFRIPHSLDLGVVCITGVGSIL